MSEQRYFDDIHPYIIEGMITLDDFNESVKEWNSPLTNRRGTSAKECIAQNKLRKNFCFVGHFILHLSSKFGQYLLKKIHIELYIYNY